MLHYFAYGSVLSLAHAREWCTSHALDVTPFLAGEPARLDGFRLVFDVQSRFWAGLVADIVPDPKGYVEGVVFTLDDSTRLAVERKEGVATGLYREHEETVLVGANAIKASCFSAVPERRVAVGPGSQRYVEALVEGARERGLTPSWQAIVAKLGKDAGRPPPPGVSLGVKKS